MTRRPDVINANHLIWQTANSFTSEWGAFITLFCSLDHPVPRFACQPKWAVKGPVTQAGLGHSPLYVRGFPRVLLLVSNARGKPTHTR